MATENKFQINVISAEGGLPRQRDSGEEVVIVPDTVGDRYAGFHFISWWEQQRLRDAVVMVVGAGALGNEVLKNLAMMGIGRLFIADFDVVEPGNLSRSILFRATDSGRSKAETAAAAIRELNPDVKLHAFNGDINTELGLGVCRRMDVIVGCLDNREARLALNSYAYRLNMPWVDGAIQEMLGVARVFWPGEGACYECTLTPSDWEEVQRRYSCTLLNRNKLLEGKVPTTPTIASIIAAVQTQEALKILHDMAVQPGAGFVFNGLTNLAYTVRYPPLANCLGHNDVAYEMIVECPQASAAKTIVAEMLDLARQHLGPQAIIELDYELVTHFRCPHCDQEAAVFKPLRRLDGRQAQCPQCGQPRQAITTHAINGREPYLEHTLAEIGIPPLHIITARQGTTYAYFELTGDAESYFYWH